MFYSGFCSACEDGRALPFGLGVPEYGLFRQVTASDWEDVDVGACNISVFYGSRTVHWVEARLLLRDLTCGGHAEQTVLGNEIA